jgi:lipase
MMSYWSELAREIVLPPNGIPTTLVRAARTSPPYVTDQLIASLRDRLGGEFQLIDFDCDHMIAETKPAEVATLIRERIR